MCTGGESHVACLGFCWFWAQRAIQNQDEVYAKNWHETQPKFYEASNFWFKHKIPAIRYFWGKDKNETVWLTLHAFFISNAFFSTQPAIA